MATETKSRPVAPHLASWQRERFGAIGETLPGEGVPQWEENSHFMQLYNQVRDLTLVSPQRTFWLYQMARHANAVKGNFAQVGVYRGGTAKVIASVTDSTRPFYLFDTFAGLPDGGPHEEVHTEGEFAASLEEVIPLFADDPRIMITKGLFPQTACVIPPNERFAFVYLDVDLYQSNLTGLKYFFPRMNPGGIMMFDDYGWEHCPGIKKSIDDFLRETGRPEVPIMTTRFQAMLIKS